MDRISDQWLAPTMRTAGSRSRAVEALRSPTWKLRDGAGRQSTSRISRGQGFSAGRISKPDEVKIHDNFFHHNQQKTGGEGYGVEVKRAHTH